jgi:hypothetical protein
MKTIKDNFSSICLKLKITNGMTNYDKIWTILTDTIHTQYPEPRYETQYEVAKICKIPMAAVIAGHKDGIIRKKDILSIKGKVEKTVDGYAVEDTNFYATLSSAFNTAKSKGIAREAEVLGNKKYEVLNYRTQGMTETKHKTKILTDFCVDYIAALYGKDLIKFLES